MQQHSLTALWCNQHCPGPRQTICKRITGEHLMEQKRRYRFRICLFFCIKNPVKMEQMQPENTKSKLRELALKWFTETQAPLILHNGNFPAWFQGFISRKDAEDHLRDKELGCFLIRLSDKATGYILSYRGRDRCRHFVINQNNEGQFIVTGDTEMHDTLTSLIEYYKSSPIEPFGEYLTVSCFELPANDLYDVVQFGHKVKPGVSVEAVRKIWDQRVEHTSQSQQAPALPPKTMGNMAIPPVPKRCSPVKTSSLEEKCSSRTNVLYAQLEQGRPLESKDSDARPPMARYSETMLASGPLNVTAQGIPAPVKATVYSELSLSDCRSKSLPLLDNNTREERSYRYDTFIESPPQLTQRENAIKTKRHEVSSHSHSLDKLSDHSFYQLAGKSAKPTNMQQQRTSISMYAEVPSEPRPNHLLFENTYEQIPESRSTTNLNENSVQGNTYETLEGFKPKPSESTWGFKSDMWKRLLPENWKK